MSAGLLLPGIWLDGDHTKPFQVGPTIWERPFERDSNLYVYRVTMRVLKKYYAPMAVDSAGPEGGFLVKESTPKSVDGTLLLEFERTFALVPNSRNEFEGFVYSFTDTITTTNNETGDTQQSLLQTPVSLTSRVQYDYFHCPGAALLPNGTNPYQIPVIQGVHYFQAGPAVFYYGTLPADSTIPTVNLGIELVAEDSIVTPWMGFIFQRKTRFVPNLNPVT